MYSVVNNQLGKKQKTKKKKHRSDQEFQDILYPAEAVVDRNPMPITFSEMKDRYQYS